MKDKDINENQLEKEIKKSNDRISRLENRLDMLSSILQVSAILASTHDLETVLDIIMNESRQVIGAEASSLLLLNQETNELEFYVVKGEKSEAVKKIKLKLGQGIAGWVAETGESVLVKDASKDNRFYKDADKQTHFVTRNLMAVALKGRRGIVGVVEVLNKNGKGTFHESDLKIFEAFAVQAGIAVENAKLYEMATTDGLTGLYTKRFFLYQLKEEMHEARKTKKNLTMLLIDIDFFKKVNDNYGHQAGDKILIVVARIMKSFCGKEYLPCRYGGEELAIIAPDSSRTKILDLGEKIRKEVENTITVCDDKEIKITVSIGCSVFSENIVNAEELVEMADLALYYGKNNGRNAVTLYNPEYMSKVD